MSLPSETNQAAANPVDSQTLRHRLESSYSACYPRFGPIRLPSTPPCPKSSSFDPRSGGVTLPDAAIGIVSDTSNSSDTSGVFGVSQTSRLALAGQECALQPKPLQTSIRFADLEPVCVLGVGGFGRVDLVRVTIRTVVNKETGEAAEHNIRHMSRGEYFGEKALLCECRRTANVYALGPSGVEVLCLYRKDFLELIGDLQELKSKPYMDEADLGGPTRLPSTPPCPKSSSFDPRSGGVTLPDAAIGIVSDTSNSSDTSGVFGVSQTSRLALAGQECALQPKPPTDQHSLRRSGACMCVGCGWLWARGSEYALHSIKTNPVFFPISILSSKVTLTYDRTQAFALKRMQKQHIVQTRQQEHVHFEKLILSSVNSPFICRLYATFRDSKHVYMLLEACLGGELWTILRDSHNLDDRTTRFCLACCIEALDYLHRHGIIYRDLKPENMLITARGYIKMCDFGFAKFIGVGQKTWTFCGTPEYVAPEVILNKGHDFAADYWSLGILTFELLTGTPPFQASEPIKIYMKTLKGIDALGLAQNKYICLKALQFIRRLCRFNPSERLGVGKHGIQEIRSHKYFQGFDWAAIAKQSLPTPFKVKASHISFLEIGQPERQSQAAAVEHLHFLTDLSFYGRFQLNGPLDYSNFDRFTMDEQEPPDESSGWDDNF
ncbi:hypothetical protein AHF37_04528 [Paragonimus kellicotti]|nr:hypothetical protein AHF37_04528 [Paragonimus kellicotti]